MLIHWKRLMNINALFGWLLWLACIFVRITGDCTVSTRTWSLAQMPGHGLIVQQLVMARMLICSLLVITVATLK
jgi:hypothetical protein